MEQTYGASSACIALEMATRCHKTGRSSRTDALDSHSWTRLSPKWRTPASKASRMRCTGSRLEIPTSVISSTRPADAKRPRGYPLLDGLQVSRDRCSCVFAILLWPSFTAGSK